jgi:hypothetical protein
MADVGALNQDFRRYDQVEKAHTYRLAESDGDAFDNDYKIATLGLRAVPARRWGGQGAVRRRIQCRARRHRFRGAAPESDLTKLRRHTYQTTMPNLRAIAATQIAHFWWRGREAAARWRD